MEQPASGIGHHISDLLFDHDCVIVPSLGGFLASNHPSRIVQPSQVIYPPYRRIAFNVYLKQNDGLLANHVSAIEKIAYADALLKIESFVADCFDQLGSGQKVSINEVGILYYDKEKNIQFEALKNKNFLKESFGLDAVHFVPVRRQEPVIKSTIRPSIPREEKKPSKGKTKKVLAILAVGAAAVWFSINLYLIAPKKYDTTSLSPFDTDMVAMTEADSLRNMPAPAPTVIEQDTFAEETPEEVIEPAVAETTHVSMPEPEPEPVLIASSRHAGVHHVIAGVFRVEENARGQLVKLQQMGFEHAEIIQANGLNYVSYDSFENHAGALSMTDSLHGKNLEGWIWKH